jgi:hypothetical protein
VCLWVWVCMYVCVPHPLNLILPQEGDHVSVWCNGNVEVSRGWYAGTGSKKMKTRPRVRSNVEVWFPEDDGGSSV